MSDQQASKLPDKQNWYDNRTMLYVWLLIFFPAGLYGLWKTTLFEVRGRIGLALAALAAFAIGGFRLINPLSVLLLFPVALFLLWKDQNLPRNRLYIFGGVWIVVFALFFVEATLLQPRATLTESGPTCVAVMTEGNCTYFRDDNCNVIARQCE